MTLSPKQVANDIVITHGDYCLKHAMYPENIAHIIAIQQARRDELGLHLERFIPTRLFSYNNSAIQSC